MWNKGTFTGVIFQHDCSLNWFDSFSWFHPLFHCCVTFSVHLYNAFTVQHMWDTNCVTVHDVIDHSANKNLLWGEGYKNSARCFLSVTHKSTWKCKHTHTSAHTHTHTHTHIHIHTYTHTRAAFSYASMHCKKALPLSTSYSPCVKQSAQTKINPSPYTSQVCKVMDAAHSVDGQWSVLEERERERESQICSSALI